MLHARVVRPPAMKATLQSWNDFECRKIPGYVGVVQQGQLSRGARAHRMGRDPASRAVETTWSDWQRACPTRRSSGNTCATPRSTRTRSCRRSATAAEALKTPGAKTVSATYDFAIHTHGSIGPSCAVAEYKDGKLTCWSASQQTHLLRKQIATMLGMTARRRALHLHRRRGLLRPQRARGCRSGRRADRQGDGPAGARAMDARTTSTAGIRKARRRCSISAAALDAAGNVLGWESEVFIPDRPKDIAVTLLAAELADLPHEPSHPGNIHQSLAIPYTVPNIRATAHWLAETPFRPSWIRTPGPHAEHVRQRKLRRRDCGRGRCRSAASSG